MKKSTLEQRLAIYKKALLHYRLSRLSSFFSFIFNTDSGFCFYFYQFNAINYPELYKQEPSIHGLYWWKEGALKPRIKALKAAIKLTEDDIRRNNT